MNPGDRVVFLDDEPELGLPEGIQAVITDMDGPYQVLIQLDDGRAFVTHESSLALVPHA